MIESVARPWMFWLLLVVPFVVYRATRSYADRSRAAKGWVAGLRGALCVLLIVELAGVTAKWRGKAGEKHLCYVADVSDSVDVAMRTQARDQIVAALQGPGQAAVSSLILFGKSPAVAIRFGDEMSSEAVAKAFEPYLGEAREEAEMAGERVSGKGTNLDRALALALTGFPVRAQKKVVLLTDGNQTDDDALQQAKAAAEQGVQVCIVPLEKADTNDVIVASISVPERIKREEAFEIKCDVRSAATKRLFGIDLSESASLDRGSVPGSLRQKLSEQQAALSDEAVVIVAERGRSWVIRDAQGDYTVREEDGELAVYAHHVDGRLRLFVDDYLAEEKSVRLVRGAKNRATFRRSLEEGGAHLLRVKFDGDFEQPTDNDDAYSYVTMPGRPRVLVVSDADASGLIEALTASRFRVEQRSAIGAPSTMLGLIQYAAIILGDVKAEEFGENRLRLLRDYVGEFGGGLIFTGGPDTFGPGGYGGTALEEASPVLMDISAEQAPSTTIIIAVDDSRSMWIHGTSDLTFKQEMFGKAPDLIPGLVTQNKADFVKQVFAAVATSLSPRDRIGAVGMSSELLPCRWYVRTQRVTDIKRLTQEFNRQFDRRSYSVLYPTLEDARFLLANDPATYKQVLLLTDGYVQSDENYTKFTMMLLSDGISLSTVGVGADCHRGLLDEMARWGGGRFYEAADLSKLGDVYQKELEARTKQLMVERPISVALLKQAELLKGLDMNLAPALFGYIRTRPKAAAQTLLAVEGTDDPLLSHWEYGSGKVVAFTSGAVGSWATLWVNDWEKGYSRFWRQLVAGVMKESGQEVYRVLIQPEGMQLKVSADVLDADANFVNQAAVAARLYYLGQRGDVFSRAVSWEAPLLQEAPGRYVHAFEMERRGVYLASVQGTGPTAGAVETAGAIIPTAKEHLNPLPDEGVLAAVAEVTGGEIAGDAAAAAAVKSLREMRRRDLGLYAVILAGLLLVAEVILRRWPALQELRRRMQASDRGGVAGEQAGE